MLLVNNPGYLATARVALGITGDAIYVTFITQRQYPASSPFTDSLIIRYLAAQRVFRANFEILKSFIVFGTELTPAKAVNYLNADRIGKMTFKDYKYLNDLLDYLRKNETTMLILPSGIGYNSLMREFMPFKTISDLASVDDLGGYIEGIILGNAEE